MLSYNITITERVCVNLRTFRLNRYVLQVTFIFLCGMPLVMAKGVQATIPDVPITLLASIRPLALIANDFVMLAKLNDRVKVEVLLQAGASPHHFALKVTDIKRIQEADTVIWSAPTLEHFLIKALREHRKNSSDLQLSSFSRIPFQEDDEGRHSHQHDHTDADAHLWLDPANVDALITALSLSLQRVFPNGHKAIIEAEVEYRTVLESLERSLQQRMTAANALKGGIAVYHDSLGAFVNRFHVHQVAALTAVPEEQMGLRSLLAHKQGLKPSCLLADKGELGMAQRFAATLEWPLVAFDLLAQNEEVNTYPAYMNAIAASIEQCLKSR